MTDISEIRHGSTAYEEHRCRCRRCTAAHTQRVVDGRRRARGKLAADDRRHGTMAGYDYYGCRCDLCRAARAAKSRREVDRRWGR